MFNFPKQKLANIAQEQDLTSETSALPSTGSRREYKGSFILGALSLGHVLIHWFQQLWPVLIPSVKSGLGLSNVEIGTLTAVRQFAAGPLLAIPSGLLADLYRRRTAIILASAFVAFGLSHFLLAKVPNFFWMVPCVAFLGVGTALWHPASMGTLSRRFPERRGTALAIHGVGASIGDTIAPIAIGFLLLSVSWRGLLEFHLIPALLIALVLWVILTPLYRNQSGEETRPTLRSYWNDVKDLMSSHVVLAIIAVNVLTGMARLTIMTFLPIYIQDDLEYSAFGLGFFWALLHVMGAISQPVMGYLSDKFGRKAVLLPALVIYGLLYLALAIAEPGAQLITVVVLLGLFFYALVNVTQATIMDVATDRIQSSTMGITGVFTQFLSLPAPILAGYLVNRYGTESSFIFAGVVTLIAALVLLMIHVPKSNRPTPKTSG